MCFLGLGLSLSMLVASAPDVIWPAEALGSLFNVKFTHCGSGTTCGGHQHCTHYEIALSDASIWRSLGVGQMSGGYDHCPGGNWEDCCSGSHNGVCSNLPNCPLDDKPATAYPVCLGHGSESVTAYVTGCCPSHHPCNICKAEKHLPGACTQDVNQADLCDNVWHALGSPSQSESLTLTIGACDAPPPTPGPKPCKDVAPDDKYTCEQQKEFGKCDRSWMRGFCCKTCFDCGSGCGKFESAGSLHLHGSGVESTNVTRHKRQDGYTNVTRNEDDDKIRNIFHNKHHYGDPKGGCLPDERNVTVEGVPGDLCSPKCSPKSKPPCPTDLPDGVTAQPQCALTNPDKTQGCCLVCSPTTDEPSLRAGDAQCGTGSCQPIQGVGVCTYGATPRPPPGGLPDACTATTGGVVMCAGDVSPEPGCEAINQLCCANSLPETFARLSNYQRTHPFHSLAFKCNGNFGGGDAQWAKLFASLVGNITGLHTLALDFSFNPAGADDLVTAVEGALDANPGVSNFSIVLDGCNMSNVGMSRLGHVLETYLANMATILSVDVRYNDPGTNPTKSPVTDVGAGKLASSIAHLTKLTSLTLRFGYDTAMTYRGIAGVAAGLMPLQHSLEALTLDFGYVAVTTPSGADPFPAFACLGIFLGGCKRLSVLSLDLDSDVNDDEAVRSLGVHVACLPVMKMRLPGFQGYDDTTDCHCGLAIDKHKKCLVPNENYPNLGSDCFPCLPHANATSCKAVKM